MSRPDAVMFPQSRKRGENSVQRALSVLEIADKYLQPDPAKGEKSHCRMQGNGQVFATRSQECTLLYPTDHPLEKQPRYNWVADTSDPELLFGYLKADPTAETAITPSPVKPVDPDNVITVEAVDSASAAS